MTRRLMYRLTTGEIVAPWVSRFTGPFRWRYNVLAAADYFRESCLLAGTKPDTRMAEAIDVIRAQRQPDGTWLQGEPMLGRVWFETDAPEGQPSTWLTLSGTRVLDWWDAHSVTA